MGAWETEDLCYKLFFEAGTQGMLLASTAGALLDANPEACAILGYGREELLRTRLRSLVDTSDPRAREVLGKRRLQAARKLGLRLLRRNGSPVEVEASLVQPADGSDDNMLGLVFRQRGEAGTEVRTDLQRPSRAEEVHEQSGQRFRSLVENAQDLITVCDPDHTIRYISPAVRRILGYEPEELVGAFVPTLLHPDDIESLAEAFEGVDRASNPSEPLTLRSRHKDGRWVHLETIFTNLLADPSVGAIVTNSRDVTERVRQEEQLRRLNEELERSVESRTAQLKVAIEEAEDSVEMLRLGQERWRALIRYASDLTVILDADGTIRYESPAVERILGFRPEDRVGTNAFDHLHPDDVEPVRAKLAELLQRPGERATTEYRIRDKEGAWHHFEAIGVNLLDKPIIGGIVINTRDITERKKAERKIEETEARYRTLVEQIPAVTYVQDPNSKHLTYVSPQIESVLGYPPDREILDQDHWLKIMHPDDRARALEEDRRTDESGEPFKVEYRQYAADGRMVWVRDEAVLVRDEGGKPLFWQGIQYDVTDQKRAEEELKKSETSLAEAQRLARIGSWEWDLQTGEISWSDEIFRICGLEPRAEVPSLERTWELVHPKDRELVREAIDEALDGDAPYDTEYRVVRPDGEVRWVHRRTEVVLRGEGGEPLKMVGTFQDVTERKRAENRLEAQYAVARVLEESTPFEEASQRILQAVCESLEWDVGVFWHRDRRTDELRCVRTWHTSGIDVSEFEAITRDTVFSRGEGFPGSVWASGQPAWIADVTKAPGFQRAPVALKEGLHGGLAFPIVLQGELLGIAEFFSCERRQPDAAVFETMTTIGAQIGQFIERRRAENELREAERRYRTLIEQLPAVTYIQDAGTSPLTYVSPQLENVLGYSPEEYLADPRLYAETIHPDDRAWVLAEDERTDRTGEPYVVECRRITRDGRVVWVRDEAVLVRDSEGRPLFWQGLLTDITERKRSEEALRQSEGLYRNVIEQAAENILLVDVETKRILEVNAAVHASLGYTSEALERMTLYDLVAHERESVDLNIERVLKNGRFFIGARQYRHKDGSLVDVEVNVSAISYGGREAMCIVAHDVTERKAAEEGLRRSLEVFLALREAGQILGSTLESEQIISNLLEIMRRVSNLTASVISIRSEDGRVHVWRSAGLENLWPRARFAPEAEAARRTVLEEETQQLFRIRRPDSLGEELTGLHLPLRARDRVLGALEAYGTEELADEETIELVGSLTSQAASALENAFLYQDLAEREQRLQELVSQLFTTQEEERRRVAYEVHDGLAQVATAAHQRLQTFVRRHPPDSKKAEDDLARIVGLVHQTVGEARRIIANLRPTALDDFGLAVAVSQALDQLRDEGWSVSCEENLGGNRLPGTIETALFRVAQEALTNARKHAGVQKVHVELSRENGNVRLRVSDEGRGFDPDSLLTAGPGERVGLAGMRERIALLGGRFELWSRPGEGTDVTVEVPLRPTEEDRPNGE